LFIFGGQYSEDTFPHITVDLQSLNSSEPKSILPSFVGFAGVVATANNEIYLLGGYDDGQRVDGILRMNSTTEEYSFIPINNIPLSPGKYYTVAPIQSTWRNSTAFTSLEKMTPILLLFERKFGTLTWIECI